MAENYDIKLRFSAFLIDKIKIWNNNYIGRGFKKVNEEGM